MAAIDTRVQDYLDDKFQSSADLDSLETLLSSVKTQQDLLKKQLDDARRDHSDAELKSSQHTASIRAQAQAFEKEQRDIDRRLLIVTQSESSDEAVRRFESSMERLRKLDVAAAYVELLQEVDKLKTECTAQLGVSDEAALDPYRKLQQLMSTLRPLQEAAEGAAPHLVDHIARQVEETRQSIQKSFSADLEATLKKMDWPKPLDAVPLALQKEWNANVVRLLRLQQQELLDREQGRLGKSTNDDSPTLLALDVLVHPLEQRFRYHFSGSIATNRLDKPEFFLHHIIELIGKYANFLQNGVQPLLLLQFRGTDLALTPAYIDVTTAFITALLPMLKRKLIGFASQVSTQPNLLSHLVYEVMSFDTTLQDSYGYSPVSPSVPWRGLAYFLLDTCGYFEQWLGVEKDFALSRYQSIIDAPDAAELDYDSISADAAKPMKAAIRLNDLLETITDRYRPLSSLAQKVRFLDDIQISIFDHFNSHLYKEFNAFVASGSAVGRAVAGVSSERQTELQGLKGLEQLCRVFGSADYLERGMRDWSDDVFFLELHEELQQHGLLQRALFDETANIYHELRVRVEGKIIERLANNFREALQPYKTVSTWASLSANPVAGATSSELDGVVTLISETFGFLAKATGKLALRRIARQTLHAVQKDVWDQVLLRHSFSTAGAMQLETDVAALCALVDGVVGPEQGRLGMRKLVEGVLLVGLPVRSEVKRVLPSRAGEEDEEGGWGDEGAEWEDTNGHEADLGGEEVKKLGLFEVDRLMFKDNESARDVLRQLGIETLSVSEAREVLKRRVEVRS